MRTELHSTNEKVLQISEVGDSVSRYVGRVLISDHGAMIYKDSKSCFLSWQEIALILTEKPATAKT